MGYGAERRIGRAAASVVGLFIAIVSIVATPSPAVAHAGAEQASTNWHVEDVRVEGNPVGIVVTMTELDNHIRLQNTSPRDVIVFGYSREPYLRITGDGVFLNDASPAGYINRSINAPRDLPARFDPQATPRWRKISSKSAHEWHDHRAHHGSRVASDGRTWSINIAIDDKPATITGTFHYRPAPTAWAAIVSIIAVAAMCGIGMLESRRQLTARVLATGLAGLFAAQLAAEWASSNESFSSRLGVFAYGAMAIAAACIAAVAASRRSIAAVAPIVLFCAVAILVCGGLTNIDWLSHSQLPTVLPTAVAQAIVGAAIVGGLGLALLAIYTIVTQPIHVDDDQPK